MTDSNLSSSHTPAVNSTYLEYLITGQLSDLTIYAPMPPELDQISDLPSQPTVIGTSQLNDPMALSPTPIKADSSPEPEAPHALDPKYNLFLKNTTTTSTTATTQTAPPRANQQHPLPGVKYMTFNLHRFIVAARSPILAILLQNSPAIYISLRSDVFQALVWLMYTDSNDNVPPHLYPYIVWASDYYAIKPGQIWALQMTMRLLNKSNIVHLSNILIRAYSEVIPQPTKSITPASTTSNTTSKTNSSTSFATTNPAATSPEWVPHLSIENCPKSLIYIFDFILHILQQVNQPDFVSSMIHQLHLYDLHPQMQLMLCDLDSTLTIESFAQPS